MNRIFALLAFISLSTGLFGQSPERMSYQAVVRDGGGFLVVSSKVGMKISVLQGSANGTAIYAETQEPVTNVNGMVSLEIGGGTVVSGEFSAIDWSAGPYFLKTETDLSGGSNYTISGASQLMSVPYAMYAKTSGSGFRHYVGELFGGGIVVAVWKDGGEERGLVASLKDVSGAASYSSVVSKAVGVQGRSPNDGQANTSALVSQGDVSGAAHLCSEFSDGGFSDWYLPSAWELHQCFQSVQILNTVLDPADGFAFDSYWSSTETNQFNGVSLHFNLGYMNPNTKDNAFRVRAVRRF